MWRQFPERRGVLLTVTLFYNLTGDTAQVGGGHEPQNEGRVDGVTLRLRDIAAGCNNREECNQSANENRRRGGMTGRVGAAGCYMKVCGGML